MHVKLKLARKLKYILEPLQAITFYKDSTGYELTHLISPNLHYECVACLLCRQCMGFCAYQNSPSSLTDRHFRRSSGLTVCHKGDLKTINWSFEQAEWSKAEEVCLLLWSKAEEVCLQLCSKTEEVCLQLCSKTEEVCLQLWSKAEEFCL